MADTIIDFELAEDTKDLLINNKDAGCVDEVLFKKIFSTNDDTLLKVTKSIQSPIIIQEIEEMTEEVIENL